VGVCTPVRGAGIRIQVACRWLITLRVLIGAAREKGRVDASRRLGLRTILLGHCGKPVPPSKITVTMHAAKYTVLRPISIKSFKEPRSRSPGLQKNVLFRLLTGHDVSIVEWMLDVLTFFFAQDVDILYPCEL